MPAPATVATVRATELFVLLMTKRDAAIAAIASGNVYVCFVNKFHGEFPDLPEGTGLRYEFTKSRAARAGAVRNKKAPAGGASIPSK
jgi:hypothetical protein